MLEKLPKKEEIEIDMLKTKCNLNVHKYSNGVRILKGGFGLLNSYNIYI